MVKSLNERVSSYSRLFNEISNQVGDDSLAVAILNNVAKDLRMEQINARQGESKDASATLRQRAFLESLGVAIDKSTTKAAASELIEIALAKQAA